MYVVSYGSDILGYVRVVMGGFCKGECTDGTTVIATVTGEAKGSCIVERDCEVWTGGLDCVQCEVWTGGLDCVQCEVWTGGLDCVQCEVWTGGLDCVQCEVWTGGLDCVQCEIRTGGFDLSG
jgi:hypothetical protein